MIKIFFIILLSGILLSNVFIIPNAQAENDVTIRLWFITSNEYGCTYRNQESLDFYESLTVQYLPLYNIHGTLIDGKCVQDIDVYNNLDAFIDATKQVDLPVIIADAYIGFEKLVIEQDKWGHYKFIGRDPINIVFCACSPYVESASSAWTYSHELSHFALHYNKQPSSVYGEWVHQVQTKYDQCEDKLTCSDLWTTITTPTGRLMAVMEPYKENENLESTKVFTIPDIPNVNISFMFPEVKLTVKQGNAIQLNGSVMSDLGENTFLPYVQLSLKKYPEGTTISTTTSDSFGHFIFDLTGVKNSATYDQNSGISTWDMYVEFNGDTKNKPAKSQTIQLIVKGIAKPPIEKSVPKNDVSKLELPQWIKTNAKWYGDGTIGELEFISAIQYMIKNEIIKIPNLPDQSTNKSEYKVPDWIKTNAKWWGEGKISDDDFVRGLHFLVDKGIIKV